jgi:hypothetical protein
MVPVPAWPAEPPLGTAPTPPIGVTPPLPLAPLDEPPVLVPPLPVPPAFVPPAPVPPLVALPVPALLVPPFASPSESLVVFDEHAASAMLTEVGASRLRARVRKRSEAMGIPQW